MIRGGIIGAGISTFLYALFVQFDPSMGNIWLRKNDENNTVFCPWNLLNLMIAPLKMCVMWKSGCWLINWFIWIIVGTVFGAVIEEWF